MTVITTWKRLLTGIVESLSLEIFKPQLDTALSNPF